MRTSRLLAISRRIDRLSELIGRLVSSLTLVMVLVGALNAVLRYASKGAGLNLSSNGFLEAQWYMFSLVFLLGAGYTLKRDGHVRVDVIYSRVSPRTRAWINLVGTGFFLIPFSLCVILMSWPAVVNSWVVREISPDPGGLPRYPIKAVIVVAFALLILQGMSEAIKQIAFLRGVRTESPELGPEARE